MQELENILQYCNIMLAAKQLGEYHKEELRLMKCSCAMQAEINSGSLKLFSRELNRNHSSKFN